MPDAGVDDAPGAPERPQGVEAGEEGLEVAETEPLQNRWLYSAVRGLLEVQAQALPRSELPHGIGQQLRLTNRILLAVKHRVPDRHGELGAVLTESVSVRGERRIYDSRALTGLGAEKCSAAADEGIPVPNRGPVRYVHSLGHGGDVQGVSPELAD